MRSLLLNQPQSATCSLNRVCARAGVWQLIFLFCWFITWLSSGSFLPHFSCRQAFPDQTLRSSDLLFLPLFESLLLFLSSKGPNLDLYCSYTTTNSWRVALLMLLGLMYLKKLTDNILTSLKETRYTRLYCFTKPKSDLIWNIMERKFMCVGI